MIKFDSSEKEVSPQMRDFFACMSSYAKSAQSYYEDDFPARSCKELDTVIWYAENIRERIKREHPELLK